jgi:hypothetical protein
MNKLRSWFAENRLRGWVTTLFLAFALLLGALLAFTQSQMEEASADYASKTSKLLSFSKQVLSPSPENVAKLEGILERDRRELESLEIQLQRFRIKPFGDLDKNKPQDLPQKFQDALRVQVNAIKAQAAQNRVELPQGFYLGLGEYENRLPSPEATLRLAKQLTVLNWMAQKISITRGIRLVEFSFPSPEGTSKKPQQAQSATQGTKKQASVSQPKPTKQDPPVVPPPYSVLGSLKVGLTCAQEDLQNLINDISSGNAPYFIIIEDLRIQNSAKEVPKRNAPKTEASKSSPSPGGVRRLPTVVGREAVNAFMLLRMIEFTDPGNASVNQPSK